MTTNWTRWIGAGVAVTLALGPPAPTATGQPAQAPRRPNFLVIVADDLGFSDLGAFGGEISTPNLDALAARGVRMTGFHTAPTCSPTRSMLMSGIDNHRAGLGSMAETVTEVQTGAPGYEGYLSHDVASLPEVLHDNGYRTVMSGKWHLGREEDQSPEARGFDRSFALLQGLSNHFGADQNPAWAAVDNAPTYRDGRKVVRFPDGAYSSDVFADRLIGFLKEDTARRPFFAYLTFTAPHWPLQAPPELIAKYKGRYDAGPEALREERLARLKALGLVPQDAVPHPLVGVPAWSSLTPQERAFEARKMEVYAAMVEQLDRNVGRVVQALKDTGAYDNTVIVFMSDNGTEATPFTAPRLVDAEKAKTLSIDNSLGNVGAGNSYVGYGPGWAQAGSAPGRLHKGYVTEGGIRAPAIVAGPGVGGPRIIDAFLHVKDILPTLLELAGLTPPATRNGKPVKPVEGHSWKAVLAGGSGPVWRADEAVGWELFYRRALRKGDWKAVYLPRSPDGLPYSRENPLPADWELYNLASDPGETTNLAARDPDRLRELVADWDRYAHDAGVVIPPPGVPKAPAAASR
ncbi:MAG: Arylsulfatase [Caulobacter sp.]|nr:Arylsulfatase [Caulobacter sp.]